MLTKNSSNDEWQNAYDAAEIAVSETHINRLTAKTINEIKAVVARKGYTRIGYCWSGGKDSLVMYDVLKKSGIPVVGGVCVLFENLFPTMVNWLKLNAPQDVSFRYSGYLKLTDAAKDPEKFLFPTDKKVLALHNPPLWKAQNRFAIENGIEVMFTGRRLSDNNFCGKKDNHYITSNESGDRFNIIAEWTHEELLAYIKYNNIQMPPCYFWKDGWELGIHAWIERHRLGEYPFTENFDELFDMDKRVLLEARKKLDIVDRYLNERGL